MRAYAFSDGSGGSPRGSSAAAVLFDSDTDALVAQLARPLPVGSNNIAEYTGVLYAVELAIDHSVDELRLFSDSQLIVNQLNGVWDVKKDDLRPLRDLVWENASVFSSVEISWVPREQNTLADSLCTDTLNEHFPKELFAPSSVSA